MQREEKQRKFAQFLLEIKAVVLRPSEPFTWASGWESPIYCDNRLVLSFPHIRDYARDCLVDLAQTNFEGIDGIAGVATGGIAQAALVAQEMALPMSYVRSDKKGHGRQNQVEGVVKAGQRILVIEDLISSGKSSLNAIAALKEKGADVVGMLALFTYSFQQSIQSFSSQGIPVYTLANYDILLQEAASTGYIPQSDLSTLQQWRLDPATWGTKQ